MPALPLPATCSLRPAARPQSRPAAGTRLAQRAPQPVLRARSVRVRNHGAHHHPESKEAHTAERPGHEKEHPHAKKHDVEDFDGLVHVDYSTWGEDEIVTHDDAVPRDFHFQPNEKVQIRLTPDKIEKAARRARRDFVYEHTLSELCIELVKFQEYVKAKGLKVVVLFEGRDAAGKGGIISRIAAAMSPRVCRIVALTAPTERERSQWYFQRYVSHLPAAGEIVLFDRSWYNRAGVEKVMGFCSDDQYEAFMEDVPRFERMLVDHGNIILVKYWLDVSDHEQETRFEGRLHRSWKRWKLSPMDLYARSKWTEYAIARDEMLKRTDHPWAPWWVIPSDNKKLARLNCISDLLSRVQYEEIHPEHLELPPRDSATSATGVKYQHPPISTWRVVPQIYKDDDLYVPGWNASASTDGHEEQHTHHDDEDELFDGHVGDA